MQREERRMGVVKKKKAKKWGGWCTKKKKIGQILFFKHSKACVCNLIRTTQWNENDRLSIRKYNWSHQMTCKCFFFTLSLSSTHLIPNQIFSCFFVFFVDFFYCFFTFFFLYLIFETGKFLLITVLVFLFALQIFINFCNYLKISHKLPTLIILSGALTPDW